MKSSARLCTVAALLMLMGCRQAPALTRIIISPASARVEVGGTIAFAATGLYADGTVRTLTDEVAWSVDDAWVAQIDTAAASGTVAGLHTGVAKVRARKGWVSAVRSLTVSGAAVKSLEIDPGNPVIPVGLGVQLRVAALLTDGTVAEVTDQVVWSGGDGVVRLSVERPGLATGVQRGSTELVALWEGHSAAVNVQVSDARVTQLDVSPHDPTIPRGTVTQLVATARLSDGTSLDVTGTAEWRSDSPATAFVSTIAGESGRVLGRAPGTTVVRAAAGGAEGSTTVVVSGATLRALEISPSKTSLPAGATLQLSLTGVFSDDSVVPLTSSALWSSSAPAVVDVAGGRARALDPGAAIITASFAGQSVEAHLTVTNATLSSLTITPAAPRAAAGTRVQLAATGSYSDGTSIDLTEQVVWTSDDTAVATVSNLPGQRGRVTAAAAGVANVNARFSATSGSAALSVTPAVLARLELSPSTLQLPVGLSGALRATGVFSDGTTQDVTAQATWESSDPSKVAVSNALGSRGHIDARAPGTAVVRATLNGVSGLRDVGVTAAALRSLSLTPQPLVVPLGMMARLVATGVYSDATTADLTTQVTWSSDDTTIAAVSNAPGAEGEVRAARSGVTRVFAALGGVQGTAAVEVTDARLAALEIAPSPLAIAAGVTRNLTVTGTYSDATTRDLTAAVSWSSSDTRVVAVSNVAGSAGEVSALRSGSAQVHATLGTVHASITVTVTAAQLVSLSLTPSAPTLAAGTTQQLTLTGGFSDGTAQTLTNLASWTSSDEAIARVSQSGEVLGFARGTATVTAVVGSLRALATITVSPAVLTGLELSPLSPRAPVGSNLAFVATARFSDGSAAPVTAQATWESLDLSIAFVSTAAGSAGQVWARAEGSTSIRATWQGRSTATTLSVTPAVLSAITVTPPAPRFARGTCGRLRATATWTDGATRDVTAGVTWTSSSPGVVTVMNAAPAQGRLAPVAPGIATITAVLGTHSGTTTVAVTNATLDALSIAPTLPSAPAGLTAQLTATGVFSDGTTQDLTECVTWTSSDPAQASVSQTRGSEGLVSALTPGAPTITASALGRTANVTFVVTPALLTGLEVSPPAGAVPLGSTLSLVATGAFSDGSTRDVTEQAAWTSSNAAVASPSNAAGTRGVTRGLARGSASVTATLSGRSAASALTVTEAVLASIAVTPAAPSVPAGLTQQLVATGTWTDGSTSDVTAQATWTAAAPAVATVSNASGQHGLATGGSTGATIITATVGNVAGAVTLDVTPAVLVAIDVSPATLALPAGLSRQLTAMGVYSDATVRDLTTGVVWSSSAAAVRVSNSGGSQGVVTALSAGAAVVTASAQGRSGSVSITATPAVLQSLQVTPPNAAVPAGLTQAFAVTGVYSDSSTQDLTAAATWSSSAPATAQVSNGAGTSGLLTALAQGAATVTATVGGAAASASVTVTPAVVRQIQVTPANASAPKGVQQRFVATGIYSDATTQDLSTRVTWTSSDPSLVSVSNAAGSEGLGATLGTGTVTVSAALGAVAGSSPFTVTPAIITSLSVSPASAFAPVGTVRQFSAIGLFSDGTTQNLTAQSAWTAANSSVAVVSNAVGSEGLVTMLGAGTTRIEASWGAFAASTSLTVTQGSLVSIDLIPSVTSTPLGYTRQFLAFGTYSNGATLNLTELVTWASSDTTKALISNAAGSRGLMSSVSPGQLTISATLSGVTGAAQATIAAAVLVSLSVTPSPVSIAAGGTRQLTATGSFSDGSTQDLTNAVTWTSSNAAVAQVSNAAESEGLVSAIAAGTAVVTAIQGAVTASATVSVP